MVRVFIYQRLLPILYLVIPFPQVPQAELETWLVQREPDPLPIVCPDLLERAPAEVERGRTAPPVEPRAGLGTLRVDEEEEDKEVKQFIYTA